MNIKDIDIERGAESPGAIEIKAASAISLDKRISINVVNSNLPEKADFISYNYETKLRLRRWFYSGKCSFYEWINLESKDIGT